MINRRDKILPDLLGRLTDNYVNARTDSDYDWESTIENYRKIVLRDLIWLLNTNLTIDNDNLGRFKYVQTSALTYGMKSLAGRTFNDVTKRTIIEEIKETIQKFEPRIEAASLFVDILQNSDDAAGYEANHKMQIQISGELLPLQVSERIHLKTEIDIETGKVELVNDRRR